jgi:urease gamma subunit
MYASYNKSDLKELYQKHKIKQTKLFIGNVVALVKCSVINSATIGETEYIYMTTYPEHVLFDDKVVAEIKNQLQDIFIDIHIDIYNSVDDENTKLVCELKWI